MPFSLSKDLRSELLRWFALLCAGIWLLHPFLTSRQMGTGDALWYANMLADFVTQWRAGIFPVFVGQTEYAFNGAIYPLRVAPLYQHLAGVLDLLTGRQLGFFALQHATVVVCGWTGLATCYWVGTRLAPSHRWLACGSAILYLGCPGVLGTIYTQDLYMTWMTVPFLPLAVYGLLRTFRQDDVRSQIWLAAPLAALWFAHSPIALWMTLIAAGTQAGRLLFVHRTTAALRRAGLGAGLFLLLGHYPFVSVASLKVPGTASAVTAGLAEQDRITNVIREVFPAVLRPVSEAAGALSDLQLGYALWGLLLMLVTVAASRARLIELRLVAAACLLLLLLLLPVPGVTDWLWTHLPEQIKRITFYWPMHRFYLLLAALLTGGGLLALDVVIDRFPRSKKALTVALLLGCSWTLLEARQFVRAGGVRTASAEATARSQRPENLLLMNHAYGLFPALPAYFSNGVVDPRTEARLLSAPDGGPLPITSSVAPADTWLHGTVDANPGVLKLSPSLRLEPGRHYELEFTFPEREIQGVLQISGGNFFRQYVLPESGQPWAFGSNPGNSRNLSLWTTATSTEEITLRFIPSAPGEKPSDFARFARYRFQERPPGTGPVEVSSLTPFRAKVNAPAAGAWLETPRMFLPGYTAEVAGQAVATERSPQGLVMLPVPAGRSEVVLSYRAPWTVRLGYGTMMLAWTALISLVLTVALRRRPEISPS